MPMKQGSCREARLRSVLANPGSQFDAEYRVGRDVQMPPPIGFEKVRKVIEVSYTKDPLNSAPCTSCTFLTLSIARAYLSERCVNY